MQVVQVVHCPNCGSKAERFQTAHNHLKTQCAVCDYLMVTCAQTGRVVEAYAPGISWRSQLVG
ncbi:replication restart DNA helicase PriA [Leptolyngbya sp. AN02str]|uniref:replication restart DNA helicase PriA n=1 Tax=Leptolyngbya sp. AN02str TaxID=3423363 RepID=UPI003D3159FF